MRKTRILTVLALVFFAAACGYGGEEEVNTGGGAGGGGTGGGGGGNPNDAVCDEVLDRMTDSVNRQCEEDYWLCCYCVCWNHNQYLTDEDDEYCYCGDPEGGQVELVMAEECQGETLRWAADLIENGLQDDEAEGYLNYKCSSGSSGGGGGDDCHSTGRLKCSGGYLWSVLRCDDGTEQLSSENYYECPCGCFHGSSVCKTC